MPPTSRSVSERKFGQKNAFVRVWSEGMGPQSFWFGIYVLWLTSFPMSGALLAPEVRITWFALPHALALLALGRWLAPHALQRLLPLAAIGTAFVTMFYAFGAPGAWSSNAAVALWVLGLTSAPLSIQFGVLLGSARWPVAAAWTSPLKRDVDSDGQARHIEDGADADRERERRRLEVFHVEREEAEGDRFVDGAVAAFFGGTDRFA